MMGRRVYISLAIRPALAPLFALCAAASFAGAQSLPPAVASAASASSAAPPQVAPSQAAPPPVAPGLASYDIGLMLGTQLSSNGLGATLSREALVRGLEDALAGKLPTPEQRQAAQQFMHAARSAFAQRNAELAHTFMDKNARESGVKTLPSGLQYRVLAAGDPKAPMPGPQDQVALRYRASLTDGTPIDRSDDHAQPAVFRMNSVIKGWREALSVMRVGAKWQVFVPPELGYGANSPAPIPPGSALIYELELLSVEAPGPAPAELMKPRTPKPAPPDSTSPASR
jgi:FKBP-type peptidyl-prolyl cis-trans isomerase FklB